MMGLPPRFVYGLYVLQYLAWTRRPAGIREMMASSGASRANLAAVVRQLHRTGLIRQIESSGYLLASPSEAISILDVASAIGMGKDGKKRNPAFCLFHHRCTSSRLCSRLWAELEAAFRSLTLAEVSDTPPALPPCMKGARLETM